MEGFSIPRSNKRTANLPSPCPLGLQSCCSTPLALYPWDSAGTQLHARFINHLYPCPSGHARPQTQEGSTLCQDPCLSRPRPLRPCWALAPCGVTGSMLCWDSHLLGCRPKLCTTFMPNQDLCPSDPCPSGPDGPLLHVKWPDPYSSRIPTPWYMPDPCSTKIPTFWGLAPAQHDTAAFQSPMGSPPIRPSQAPALQAWQITTPTGLVFQVTTGELQTCLRGHTERTGC
jgi:hypothetical protein